MANILRATLGGLIFIVGLLGTLRAWYIFRSIGDYIAALGSTLPVVIYYVGLMVIWISLVIITPLYMIIKSTEN